MNDGDTSHDGSLDIEEFTRLVTKVCGTVYLMSLSVSASNFSVVVDVAFVHVFAFWRSLFCSLTSASPLLSMLLSLYFVRARWIREMNCFRA
jgi:hypothetical protein